MKKTNKTISSKKGFISSTLIDFYAFIVFILVVLIFFVIFSLMKGCDGTPSLDNVPHQKSDVDSNYVLTTWLRKPVFPQSQLIIDDPNNMNIADLIAFSQTDEKLKKLRDENINTFFNNSYNTWWNLHVNYPDGTTEKYGHSYTADFIPSTILAVTIALVLPPGLNYVHAYLILPEAEKIKINQSIPSLDKDPINIEFSKWVIVYFPHIPFI